MGNEYQLFISSEQVNWPTSVLGDDGSKTLVDMYSSRSVITTVEI